MNATNFWKLVFALIALLWFGTTLPGCAGEIVAMQASKMAGTSMTVLANKIPIDSGSMEATGTIDQPEYVVEALYVQGVRVTAQLKGAKITGRLYGQGSGGSNKIDPELAALIERYNSDPNNQTLARNIAEAVIRSHTTSQPSNP